MTLIVAFLLGALVSLGTSWLLVSRLERVGDRLGLSEGALGLLAALAADAPEVTSAVTALIRGEHQVGAGVVVGSNVFNLAALLGLSAIVAGGIALHRRVVLLGGLVGIWIAGVCLVAVQGLVAPPVALALALAALLLYGVILSTRAQALGRLPVPKRWARWLASAVAEEEQELEAVIHPQRGTLRDAGLAGLSLLLVVVGSVTMERAASALGVAYAVPQIVVGGLVLAAVTSLPNAVAAIYLSARGRGAAVLSTALNSNAINVVVGLLFPGTVLGLGAPSSPATFTAAWFVGMTVAVLVLAYSDRGLGRGAGVLVVAGYLVFVGSLLVTVRDSSLDPVVPIAAALAMALATAGRLGIGPLLRALEGEAPLLPGWPVHRVWAVSIVLTALVAAVDALLGSRIVLIGLLIVGPCCALLSGRWVLTALTACWSIGLTVLVGLPDGIWATGLHLTWLTAVAVAALAATVAAVLTSRARE